MPRVTVFSSSSSHQPFNHPPTHSLLTVSVLSRIKFCELICSLVFLNNPPIKIHNIRLQHHDHHDLLVTICRTDPGSWAGVRLLTNFHFIHHCLCRFPPPPSPQSIHPPTVIVEFNLSLNNQCHVLFAWQIRHLLALPQRVVNCKCVYCHRQVLRVDLREALAARIVSASGN